MISKDEMVLLLRRWGRWQRTAKDPNLSYAISQYDTPLQKQRNVTPIYKDYTAEKIESIMIQHLSEDEKFILQLTYVDQKINATIAQILHCCPKTLITTRNEIIACMRGLYSCLG